MRRSRGRVSALVALVAFVASFALPFMTPRHAWIVDPDAGWDVVPVVAGAGAAAIGNPTTTPEAEHCAICHWMRALGSSMAGAPVKRLTVAPPRLVPGAAVAMPRTALTFDRPARAPPVSIA